MKPFTPLFIFLLLPTLAFTQLMQQPQLGKVIDSIDKIIAPINLTAAKSAKTFTIKSTVSSKPVTEKWVYCYSPVKQLIYLQVSYNIDSIYFEEDYYVSNSDLLYSEEKKIYHMPASHEREETSHWMEYCYFIKDRLIHERSSGHGKTEMDGYDPEKEVLKRFAKRRRALSLHTLREN